MKLPSTTLLGLALLGGAAQSEHTILDEMGTAYERLDTLEAEITQVASYPQLGLTDPPEKGLLQVQKDKDGINVRLEITEPEHRILVVKDGAYTFYQPRIKQAIVGQAGGSGHRASFLKYLLGDVSQAEEDFVVDVVGPSADVADHETIHLVLAPREEGTSHYERIELWVDEELGLPIQEKLVEPNGDEVVIRLEDVRMNAPGGELDFELDLPDDVERIKG